VGATGPAGPDAVWGDESAGSLTIDASNSDWWAAPTSAAQSGNYQFSDVTVNSAWRMASGVTIRATGVVTINQSINVQAPQGNTGLGIAEGLPGAPQKGYARVGASLASILHLAPGLYGGSGGGPMNGTCSAPAGGAFAIYAKGGITIGPTATIVVDAPNATGSTPGCGGGGGGIVILASEGPVFINGHVSVNGGNGTSGFAGLGGISMGGAGGGGGLIRIISPNAASTTDIPAANLSIAGGGWGQSVGSGSVIANGYGGGASGGDGGSGGGPGGITTPPTVGSAGKVLRTQTSNVTSMLAVK
jgi:hypothetical protein